MTAPSRPLPPSRQLPAVRLPTEVRAAAERLAIELTAPAGRRLTIREVVSACVLTAGRHRTDLLAALAAAEPEGARR